MDENERLLTRLYDGLQSKDHEAAAACYHPTATFTDIAFNLSGKKHIHAMWHLVTATDIRLSYRVKGADQRNGTAHWVADYTFSDTGRKVHNELTSQFTFENGLIRTQTDECDALRWGVQALGPIKGFAAWLIPAIRRKKAAEKLAGFITRHPEYR